MKRNLEEIKKSKYMIKVGNPNFYELRNQCWDAYMLVYEFLWDEVN